MRILGEPAYVLHARPWRETSLLVEVLCAEHGRLGLVARGIRGPKRQALRAALQEAADAAESDGVTIRVTSGWRSAAHQRALLHHAHPLAGLGRLHGRAFPAGARADHHDVEMPHAHRAGYFSTPSTSGRNHSRAC